MVTEATEGSQGRRRIIALVLAGLTLFYGVAMGGASKALEGPGATIDRATFSVEAPKHGDRGSYLLLEDDETRPKDILDGGQGYHFEWLSDGRFFGPEGSLHETHRLMVWRQAITGDKIVLWDEILHVDRDTGQAVGSESDSAWSEPYDGIDTIDRDRTYHMTYYRPARDAGWHPDAIPCGVIHPLQGVDWRLDEPVRLKPCFFPGWVAIENEAPLVIHRAFMDDEKEHVDIGTADGQIVWRFRADVPYPVLIQHRDDRYVLDGFETGDQQLAPGPAATTGFSPLAYATPPAWGIDDNGIDHPWPLHEAWDEVLTEPAHEDVQAYLRDHPEAEVVATRFNVESTQHEIMYRWRIHLSDGPTGMTACPTQIVMHGVPGPVAALDPQSDVYALGPGSCGGAFAFTDVPDERRARPTVASLSEAWRAIADAYGLPAGPLDYGLTVETLNDRPIEQYHVGVDLKNEEQPAPMTVREELAARAEFHQNGSLLHIAVSREAIDSRVEPGTRTGGDGSTPFARPPHLEAITTSSATERVWAPPGPAGWSLGLAFAALVGGMVWHWPALRRRVWGT